MLFQECPVDAARLVTPLESQTPVSIACVQCVTDTEAAVIRKDNEAVSYPHYGFIEFLFRSKFPVHFE